MNQTIPVELGARRYDIVVVDNGLERLEPIAPLLEQYSHAFIITDSNLSKLLLPKLKRRLKKHIGQVESSVCPSGESAKVIEIAYAIWQKMMGAQCDRRTLVVALGGGVVGDLAGFIAATFMRGVDLLQIPTTLLAQVDSSVGGKVGINLPQGKNLVGAFWQPRGVLIDTKVLATLPEREYRAGLAEVVKYGVILSKPFFDFLEAQVVAIQERDSQVLAQLVAECCRMKASVVVEDECETKGIRSILNFGHTYGHALERLMGYGELIHGEAVAIGMRCAMDLGVALKRFDAASRDRVVALLKAFQLPVRLPAGIPADEVAKAMHSDKKKENHEVRLILPVAIGKVESTAWPGDELVTATLDLARHSD